MERDRSWRYCLRSRDPVFLSGYADLTAITTDSGSTISSESNRSQTATRRFIKSQGGTHLIQKL